MTTILCLVKMLNDTPNLLSQLCLHCEVAKKFASLLNCITFGNPFKKTTEQLFN